MTKTAPVIRQCVVLPRVTAVPAAAFFAPDLAPPASREVAVPAASTAVESRTDAEARPAPPRRRAWMVLAGAVAAAVLIAVPLLLVTSPGRPERHTGSSAADRTVSGGRPGAPPPSWPGARPSVSPPATGSPTPSATASAKPGKGGGHPATTGKGGQATHGGGSGPGHSSSSSGSGAAGSSTRSITSYASHRCISVSARVAKDGSPLEIRDCGGASWQKWSFPSDGSVRSMGMCMDVAWGSSDNGTTIQLARCNGGAAQRFDLNGAGDLVNLGADKCVDVKDKQTANGTRLQLWDCAGTSNQKWSAV